MDYPFVPKSAVKLEHGHFWGIELISGAWAAGVVIQPMREARPGNRTAIIAGLLDWKGPEPPTDSDLADVTSYVMITVIHFKAITWHGGQVLGQLDNVPQTIPTSWTSHLAGFCHKATSSTRGSRSTDGRSTSSAPPTSRASGVARNRASAKPHHQKYTPDTTR